MPENKFDLNKALQAAKLYTPIDYRIQVPQLSTMRNFENWRTDQGYKTEKEKQKEFEDNIKAMQERTVGLSDADSATDWYHAMETNPVKRAEWDRQAAAVTGHGIGAIATIASAGTMGWIPSLISTGTGYAGGYGGYKLGEAIDNRYGTNTAPWLSLIGGFTGGMGGYKGLIKAGNAGLLGTSPYTHLLNGRQNLAYGSQFTKNLVDDIATTSLRKYIPTYGTVKYYGPTMGKTTAAKSNPNLVDFDDYVRPELEQLASELGMTRQQLMMSQDPTVREKARQLMLKSVDGWKKNASNDGKTLVISKSDILQDPIFDNQPLVLQRNEFLKRNAARGETDIQNSLDWYASTRRKGEGKLMEWPDSEGVYISELEPFTPDPHHITFAPQPSKKGSYAFFERPSKLTFEERLGIPKGERNQPAKAPTKNQTYKKTANLESDKDYLEDIEAIHQGFLGKTFLDSEHEALLDWFNSPQYKERLVKQGFSEEQINNLLSNIKNKLSRKNLKYAVDLNSVRQWGIGPGMALEIDPQLYPAYEAMTNGNIKIGGQPINWSLIQLKKGVDLDEMVPHEVGGHHLESLVAEFNAPYTSQQITDMGKKAAISSGLPEGYYPSWWETRARALTIAKQMREAGWNPNSPEQVNVWLNKHLLKDHKTNVVQGALYYDRPKFIKAVATGLKQGGKL